MKNLALYQIAEQYRSLTELSELELPEQVLTDTLEGLTGDLETKATNVALFARNLESLAEQIKEAEKAMSHRRKVLENRAESIKNYIRQSMETAGIQKISCPYFELAVVKNPQMVEIEPETVLPEEYMRTPEPPPKAPDKKLILEDLKNGKEITGCKLVQTKRLRIK